MLIGIPRETAAGELRVAGTPTTVGRLTRLGLEVAVEAGAGLGSAFTDGDYEAAGASVDATGARVRGADIVLRVRKPGGADVDGLAGGCVTSPRSTWPPTSGRTPGRSRP